MLANPLIAECRKSSRPCRIQIYLLDYRATPKIVILSLLLTPYNPISVVSLDRTVLNNRRDGWSVFPSDDTQHVDPVHEPGPKTINTDLT